MPVDAMYPGTFDPITNGHTDLIARAAIRFERVIVAIHRSAPKQPAFDWQQRVELARAVVEGHANVEVEGFEGLLVDFARARGASPRPSRCAANTAGTCAPRRHREKLRGAP